MPLRQRAPVSPGRRSAPRRKARVRFRLRGPRGVGLVSIGRPATSTRHDLERFAVKQAVARQSEPPIASPDQLLWSPTRINAWRGAIADPDRCGSRCSQDPQGSPRSGGAPRTEYCTLDRGLGPDPVHGAARNRRELGHRGAPDNSFRALKDIRQDDLIQLDTPQMTDVYRVERTWIVNPDDVSVLDPTPMRALTLVTCYPFYYVGSAPKRFIVRANGSAASMFPWRPSGYRPVRLTSRNL